MAVVDAEVRGPDRNFIWGGVSEHFGVEWSVVGCGIAIACAGLWFSFGRGPWKKAVVEVYRKRGILPAPQNSRKLQHMRRLAELGFPSIRTLRGNTLG